ncbi:Thioesterase/thiol ester dehydrase-isomerase [Sanghuangporus baumii]|uniref:Thioesterase/thiol ester dehydrase-isomerase n=1 Tax=Sanghuangporus baumii TaxID=108892 RepID=A0A9Q5I1L5_SANBA|nr:Thioesterase/thiol ester dehydrase-isomerase [Sanghuangporus baumii]
MHSPSAFPVYAVQLFQQLQIHRAIPGELEASLKIEPYNGMQLLSITASLDKSKFGSLTQSTVSAYAIIFFGVFSCIDFDLNTVHGGLILSLTDTLGSLAVATKGNYMTGVSIDIGTSFLRPAGKPGDILKARATIEAMGKTLAFTRVDFTNPAGDIVAYGQHTKFIGKSIGNKDDVKFSEDGERVIEGTDKE